MRLKSVLLLSVSLLAVLFPGCSKSAPPADFQSAFKSTPSQVKEFAEQGVQAEKQNDFSTAFRHYRALSLNPELTQEQRNFANQSMLEMSKKLREAAEKGDKEAGQVLEDYRATK
jgi:PBP1b-binding outer membrane lipoprotein LpoB